MASKKTVLECLRKIEIAYGEKLAAATTERIELYFDILSDLPDDALVKATLDQIASQEYPPKPAQLRSAALAVETNHGASIHFDDPEAEKEYRRRLYWTAMGDWHTFDKQVYERSKALTWWRQQQAVKDVV